jgi:hypothetical protein
MGNLGAARISSPRRISTNFSASNYLSRVFASCETVMRMLELARFRVVKLAGAQYFSGYHGMMHKSFEEHLLDATQVSTQYELATRSDHSGTHFSSLLPHSTLFSDDNYMLHYISGTSYVRAAFEPSR